MVQTISESFPSDEDFIAPHCAPTTRQEDELVAPNLPSLRSGGFDSMWFGSYASSVADSVSQQEAHPR